MSGREVREKLAAEDPELLFADGFDGAILGIVDRVGQETFVVYDAGRCVEILQRDNPELSLDDAVEYFDHNVAGAWVGDRTPGFVWLEVEDEDEVDDE